MATYLVERYAPWLLEESLEAFAARLEEAARCMRDAGVGVVYRHSAFVRAELSCLCLFDAPSEEAVREANDRAGAVLDRVVEVELALPADRL